MTKGLSFMSSAHVAAMNDRLVTSIETYAACKVLPRNALIAYRLVDEDTGSVVWWQMSFSPIDGVRFALGEPFVPTDLVFHGGYWDMVDAARSSRDGRPVTPNATMLGDEATWDLIREAFAIGRQAATLEVIFPRREASYQPQKNDTQSD